MEHEESEGVGQNRRHRPPSGPPRLSSRVAQPVPKPDLHDTPRRQRLPALLWLPSNSNQRIRVMLEYIVVIVLAALAAYTEYDKRTRRCGPATESHRAGDNAPR